MCSQHAGMFRHKIKPEIRLPSGNATTTIDRKIDAIFSALPSLLSRIAIAGNVFRCRALGVQQSEHFLTGFVHQTAQLIVARGFGTGVCSVNAPATSASDRVDLIGTLSAVSPKRNVLDHNDRSDLIFLDWLTAIHNN